MNKSLYFIIAIVVLILGACNSSSIAPMTNTPTISLPQTATLISSPTPTSTLIPSLTPTPHGPITAIGTPLIAPRDSISLDNVDQLDELAQWGKGSIQQVAWSPDGKNLAMASSIGLYIYDAKTMNQMQFLPMGAGVLSVTYSPKGDLLAIGLDNGTVVVWNIASETEIYTFSGHKGLHTEDKGHVFFVSFSPDGQLLASGSDGGTVKLWSLADGKSVRELIGYSGPVENLTFSPDGILLAPDIVGTVIRWEVATGQELPPLSVPYNNIVSLALSPDGRTLALGLYDNTVRILDLASGRELRKMGGLTDYAFTLAFSTDSKLLAIDLADNLVNLWDVTSGRELHTLSGLTDQVFSMVFSPDGLFLASASYDNTVRLWQLEDGTLVQSLDGFTSLLNDVAFSPDGTILALAQGSAVNLRLSSDGRLLRSLEANKEDYIDNVLFSSDGKLLVSLSFDSVFAEESVRVWRIKDGTLLYTLSGNCVAVSPIGQLLAVGSGNSIDVRNITSGQKVRTLSFDDNVLSTDSVAFSPDGTLLAGWGTFGDNIIKLWNMASGEGIQTLTGLQAGIHKMVFSPNGTVLALTSQPLGGRGTIQLWRAADGKLLQTFEGESIGFSLDGKLIALGKISGEIWILNAMNNQEIRTLQGHSAAVESLGFSSDSTLLVSGSYDNTIRMWGVRHTSTPTILP